MFGRKGLAVVALSAIAACAGFARAADTAPSSDAGTTGSSFVTSNQPVLLQDAAAAPASKPLMAALEKIGVGKPLEDWGINLTGYIEGSWTFDANHPTPGGLISDRTFDVQEQSIILDQIDLTVSRAVDSTKGKFDVGFYVEQIYGTDSSFIHSNGMTVYSPTKIGLARTPKEQYDLNQAYLTFAVPVGKGLTLTVGKFDTLLGYEVINPSANNFFSHSLMFTQLPFTQTGVMGQYHFTDEISAIAGVTRGWDQALKDVNGSLDFLGQVAYTKDAWSFLLNVSTGDQEPTASALNGWRTVLDLIATYQYSDNLKLGANLDYGWEPQVDAGSTAIWYGAAVYAGYKISDMFTLNGRGEFFDANDGFTPSALGPAPNHYFEGTVGVAITPFPNGIGDKISGNWTSGLVIRPEIRLDYADHGSFTGDNTHDQLTAAIEAYYAF